MTRPTIPGNPPDPVPELTPTSQNTTPDDEPAVSMTYVLHFLISFQGPVVPLISINEYFDSILLVLLGLGLVFELPVLIFVLSLFGIVTPKFLMDNFRYAILIIAILAAILTPTPDAMTMLVFMGVLVGL